ncbi:MAG: mannose-1-phosphate guanylyltransferase/mannose-6-phosphate isomerase [Rickettsiaceae bacterium]|nr:mannose-1-phosphate guanylyltransferase/mannose-6-phosphate isomerase [Rickettsiaceae bacterium]
MNIVPVIMAGGHGTRLWPLSRENYPKQFIKIFDCKSLFQLSLLRNKDFLKPVVIVGVEHRFIAKEQADEIGIEIELIIEPVAKNTAPCAIIASYIIQNGDDRVAVLLPADHYINEEGAYVSDIKEAVNLLKNFDLVTIGIKPTSPHTGYGYIETKENISHGNYSVNQFVEKPSLDKAIKFINSKNFYWNAGIVLFTKNMDKIIKDLIPMTKKYVESSIINSTKDLDFIRLAAEDYGQIESNSMDYAIMEKAENIALREASFTWSDLGNFDSVWQVQNKDENNNLCEGDAICIEGNNNYIYSPHKLTVVSGLSDLVVINTLDALLVTSRDQSEEIKNIVSLLRQNGRTEAINSDICYRPWGSYQVIDEGQIHKVKLIIVHPGKKLSLQYHHNRAEHWVVVKGVAEVQIGEEMKNLYENDSIYIPKLMKHSLHNIGEVDLHLIEVQTGSYLGEDDIVRLADLYGR